MLHQKLCFRSEIYSLATLLVIHDKGVKCAVGKHFIVPILTSAAIVVALADFVAGTVINLFAIIKSASLRQKDDFKLSMAAFFVRLIGLPLVLVGVVIATPITLGIALIVPDKMAGIAALAEDKLNKSRNR